tara:strand:- start:17310 stop:17513 length:204 start_codon:yes stop_codon:yes gene_type:complete
MITPAVAGTIPKTKMSMMEVVSCDGSKISVRLTVVKIPRIISPIQNTILAIKGDLLSIVVPSYRKMR